MMRLLVLAAVAVACTSALDAGCKPEWKSKQGCFYGLFADAVGLQGTDILGMPAKVKQCLLDSSCKVPKSLGGDHDDHHHRVKRGGNGRHMKNPLLGNCVKEELDGKTPMEVTRECVAEKLPGVNVPDFMLKSYHGGHKRGPSKCPFRKMIKFLAMAPEMETRVNDMCDQDAAKAATVIECIEGATGVDVTAVDRDEVKDAICGRKDECITDKMRECRTELESEFTAACDCKMELVKPAREKCMADLEIDTGNNPHASMTCDELKEMTRAKYDMCSDSFEWPEPKEHHGHHHARARRHNHDHTHDGHTDGDSGDSDHHADDDSFIL